MKMSTISRYSWEETGGWKNKATWRQRRLSFICLHSVKQQWKTMLSHETHASRDQVLGAAAHVGGGHVKIWYTGIKAIWKGNQFIKSPNHKAFSHTFSYENTPRLMRSKNFRYWLNSAYGQPFSQTILLSACGQCFFPKCCSIAIHAKWTGTYVYLCSSAGAKITSTHISKCINVQQLCSKLMIDYHPLLYKNLILHWFRTLSNTRLWQ